MYGIFQCGDQQGDVLNEVGVGLDLYSEDAEGDEAERDSP